MVIWYFVLYNSESEFNSLFYFNIIVILNICFIVFFIYISYYFIVESDGRNDGLHSHAVAIYAVDEFSAKNLVILFLLHNLNVYRIEIFIIFFNIFFYSYIHVYENNEFIIIV